MYQFIVTTRNSGNCVRVENSSWSGAGTTVGDISTTMSFAGNGTNKWASRAVVALQLAAWSAVGIVLLEKGVTSLQKSSHTPRNVSQEITTPVSSSDSLHSQVPNNPTRIEKLSENEIDSLSVVPTDGDEENTLSNGLELATVEKSEEVARHRGESAGSRTDTSAIRLRQKLEETNSKGIDDAANKNEQLNQLNGLEENNRGNKDTMGNKGRGDEVSEDKETKSNERKVKEDEKKEAANGNGPPQDKTWSSPVTIKIIMDNLNEHRWESRKRLRVARVNAGGGAAAAVAMVAVGAVMLILGPVVIILRALDERRQERRFLKLSGEEDLPPSYEEATCDFDEAPTYSSLNLDSILATPASPNLNASENSCLSANCRRGS